MCEEFIANAVHFISACHSGEGNKTACGKAVVYPMRGNGWRVKDITCPDCDRIICDMAHANFASLVAAGGGE